MICHYEKIINKILLLCLTLTTVGYVFNEKVLINIFFVILFIKLIVNAKYKLYTAESSKFNHIYKLFGLMVLFSVSLWVSSTCSYEIADSFKAAKDFTKWMFLPFLSACFIVYKLKYADKYALYGLVISNCLIIYDLFWNYFILHINRPGALIFEHPNSVAGIVILILPFIILNKNINTYVKSLFCILNIAALFITESRGAILAFLVVASIYIFVNRGILIRKVKQNTLVTMSIILATMLIMGSVITFSSNNKIYNRFSEIIKYHDSMAKHHIGGDRLLLWESSIDMIQDYPFGVGLRNFNKVYNEGGYISIYAKEKWLESPHNIFLHVFVETGLLGGLLFIGLLIYQIKWLWRYKSNRFIEAYLYAVIGMCIHGLVDYNFLVRVYYQLYWFLCGVAWMSYRDEKNIE